MDMETRKNELLDRRETVIQQIRWHLINWYKVSNLLDKAEGADEQWAADFIVEALEEQERQMWDRLEEITKELSTI